MADLPNREEVKKVLPYVWEKGEFLIFTGWLLSEQTEFVDYKGIMKAAFTDKAFFLQYNVYNIDMYEVLKNSIAGNNTAEGLNTEYRCCLIQGEVRNSNI